MNFIDQFSSRWEDPLLFEALRNKGFTDQRYMDRKHMLALKWNEINMYYPEYLQGGKKYLDICSGNGASLEIMRALGHTVMGADIERTGMLLFLDSQDIPYTVLEKNAAPFPFPDKSYNLVTCVGGLHHCREDWAFYIRDLCRIAIDLVFVSISRGDSFDRNRHMIDDLEIEGWCCSKPLDHMYKWSTYR